MAAHPASNCDPCATIAWRVQNNSPVRQDSFFRLFRLLSPLNSPGSVTRNPDGHGKARTAASLTAIHAGKSMDPDAEAFRSGQGQDFSALKRVACRLRLLRKRRVPIPEASLPGSRASVSGRVLSAWPYTWPHRPSRRAPRGPGSQRYVPFSGCSHRC
jgi:hypothetical protein